MAQTTGPGRVSSFEGVREGSVSSLSPWFVDGCLQDHVAFSLYACLFKMDTSHVALEPIPAIPF